MSEKGKQLERSALIHYVKTAHTSRDSKFQNNIFLFFDEK